MKKASYILLGFCLVSTTLTRNIKQPNYIGYQDSLGQYSFGYSAPGSARSEVRESNGQTRGSYSYVDDNGLIQSAEYTADAKNGFRISATNLPQHVEDTSEVKAARAAHLEAVRLAYEREEQKQQEFGQPGSGQESGQNEPEQGFGQPGSGQESGQGFGRPELGQPPIGQQEFGQPGVGQPGIGQQISGQPGFGQPGIGEPIFVQPGIGQPGIGNPIFSQPGIGNPIFGQPGIGNPIFGQPGIGQPVFALPGFDQPGIGQPGFGQPEFGQPGIGQPGFTQQEQAQFGESVVVDAKIGNTEAKKLNQNVNAALPKQIVGHVHTNVVSEVPEALESAELNAARRAYIQAISAARTKAENGKINYVVNDVITRVSSSLGPVAQTTVTDERATVGQHPAQPKNFQTQGQVSLPLGSLLKAQGLSQSSGIAPSSTTLIVKNETYPLKGFMGQTNLKDKQSPPVAGTQLYRLAVPSHISKPLIGPSAYVPIKYSSSTGTPRQQPSYAV